MKIAFASTDQIHVDEHFGQAEKFYVWTVGPEEANFSLYSLVLIQFLTRSISSGGVSATIFTAFSALMSQISC